MSRILRRTGFTLIELMVVCVIIMILISILLPSLKGAKTAARTALCANRLHQNYIASGTRKADLDTQNVQYPASQDWMASLAPYGPLAAAEDAKPLQLPLAVASSKLYSVGWMSALSPYLGDEGRMFICPEDEGTGASSLSSYRMGTWTSFRGGWAFAYYTNYEEGPWVLMTNINSSGFRLQFEDIQNSSSDYDYWDHVADVDTDAGVVTAYKGVAGYRHDIVDAFGNILFENVGTASVQFSFGSLGSYAMNMKLDNAPGDHENVIFLMDYYKPQVNPDYVPVGIDDWSTKLNSAGVPIFARHAGKCNALSTAGDVSQRDPLAFDPAVAGWERAWGGWLPPP